MAMAANDSSMQRRRGTTAGQKLAPLDTTTATPQPRKIFSKKDLVESVRKMAVSIATFFF
jgi:hypothetical protein